MMENFTSALFSGATTFIFGSISRNVNYGIFYKETVQTFEEKLTMLKAKRARVEHDVQAAKNNGETIQAEVQLWCERVDAKIKEGDEKVRELEAKIKYKCFNGLCPNIKSRHQVARIARDESSALDELLEQQRVFTRSVAYREVPQAMADLPPKDFVAFGSRQKFLNGVMGALKDDTISIIGVYGKEGVGKTILVNEVARQAQKAALFDWVVNAAVTQIPDISEIQQQIIELLGLDVTQQTTEGRAQRLFAWLTNDRKKILVVLDGIQGRLNLYEVGIPFGDYQNNGCKILLISRNQNVLSNVMDAEKTFGIDVLEEGEAWELFKKMVGDIVESDELRPIAIKVVQNCAGLPAVIARVARYLRNKPVFVWRDASRNKQLFAATSDR